MKKLLAIMVTVLLVVSAFVACSPTPAATAPSDSQQSAQTSAQDLANAAAAGALAAGKDVSNQRYIMCSYNSTEYYQSVLWQGFKDAADMLGVKAELYGGSGEDILQYISLFDQAAASDPCGIAVMCLDAGAYVDSINAARDKGLPVFVCAPDSPNSKRNCFLGLDNIAIGKFAGQYIGEQVGDGGEWLVLVRPGMQTCQDRLAGFEEYVKANYPNVKIDVIQVSLDITEQTAKASAALSANPNYSAVYCPLGWQAVSVSQAIDELGYNRIPILGMDVELAQLELIKEGKLMATLKQGNYDQGFWACLGMYLIENGYVEEDYFPAKINPGYHIVDKSNVDEEIEYYYRFNPDAKKN